jgi:acetyl-CoA acetyltransferase
MEKIKLKSVYMTRFGCLEADYRTLAMEAFDAIMSQADPSRVSDVYLSSFAPRELAAVEDPVEWLASTAGERHRDLEASFHGPFKTGGEALHTCLENFDAESGAAVVIGVEKMTHLEAGRSAGILAATVNPHDRRYGATLPALGAIVAQAYQRKFRVPASAFDAVAAKNHRNGALNPRAQFRKIVTEEEVAASPMVSDPLRRLHCAPLSDGAAALLIDSGGRGIHIRGWAEGLDMPIFHERNCLDRFRATKEAARKAFSMSGLGHEDIDVVEIHDAFSPFELINLEELGFYPLGGAWRALRAGEFEINGRLAVNPSGGLKSRGHPIGACGLSSIVEVFEQLNAKAGPRQHAGAEAGIVQSAGGVSRRSYVFILSQ